jgi:hypothetical protein
MLEADARPSVTLRIAEEDAFSARRRNSRPFVLYVERKERGTDCKLESDLGSLGSMRQAVENEVGEDLAKIGPSSHPHACGAARQRQAHPRALGGDGKGVDRRAEDELEPRLLLVDPFIGADRAPGELTRDAGLVLNHFQ